MRLTASGGTGRNSCRAVKRSFSSSHGNGPKNWITGSSRNFGRFAYESHDDSGNWFRSYGNENWEFNPDGLVARRIASINDLPISESDRKFFWPLGRRPDEHPGLSDFGL